MDTERARELLPWLLNGSLEEPERGELLAALRGDVELRRELAETRAAGEIFAQHVPAGDLVGHAFGTPTALAAERIEAHLALCEPCREELALVHESRGLASGDEEAGRTTGGILPFRPFRRGAAAPGGGLRPAFALAASLTAMIGFGGWLATWQVSQGKIDDLTASLRESVPPVEARAVVPGGSMGLPSLGETLRGDQAPRLAPGGPDGAHELIAHLPETEAADPTRGTWELRVIDPGAEGGARELIRARPAPGVPGERHLVFRVPALPPGEHVAELRRLDPRRGWVLVERYGVPVGPGG